MYSPFYNFLFSILISIVQTVNTMGDYETDCATALFGKVYQNCEKQLLAALLALTAKRSNGSVPIPE